MTSNDVWTTSDGQKIPISELTNSHLTAILRLFRRKGFVGVETLRFYLTCPEPNGEMAQDAFNEEQNDVFSAPCSSWVDTLESEAMVIKMNLEDI